MAKSILLRYRDRRLRIIMMLVVLAVLMSWAKFLWDIEARNLWVSCFPETTYLACFNGQNIAYTSLGFLIYPIAVGWIYLGVLMVPVVIFEIVILLRKAMLS